MCPLFPQKSNTPPLTEAFRDTPSSFSLFQPQIAFDREVPFRNLRLGASTMISVIVPVYNSGHFLERTIAGLESQDYDRTRYEIIMVDNNSSDDSVEIIRRHP